jgi:hypothetical protein
MLPVADTVQRLDLVKFAVGELELLAQPFDVAVYGAVSRFDVHGRHPLTKVTSGKCLMEHGFP